MFALGQSNRIAQLIFIAEEVICVAGVHGSPIASDGQVILRLFVVVHLHPEICEAFLRIDGEYRAVGVVEAKQEIVDYGRREHVRIGDRGAVVVPEPGALRPTSNSSDLDDPGCSAQDFQ